MADLNRCIFPKNLVLCSSAGPKIFSANFQQILDCFIPNFKSKYADSENKKAYRISAVDLTYIKSNVKRFFFWGGGGGGGRVTPCTYIYIYIYIATVVT